MADTSPIIVREMRGKIMSVKVNEYIPVLGAINGDEKEMFIW